MCNIKGKRTWKLWRTPGTTISISIHNTFCPFLPTATISLLSNKSWSPISLESPLMMERSLSLSPLEMHSFRSSSNLLEPNLAPKRKKLRHRKKRASPFLIAMKRKTPILQLAEIVGQNRTMIWSSCWEESSRRKNSRRGVFWTEFASVANQKSLITPS